jgi:hypothetical protein
MGTLKQKSEGGRRGRFNMDHWVTTAEIKTAARGRRRRDARLIITKEKSEAFEEKKRA